MGHAVQEKNIKYERLKKGRQKRTDGHSPRDPNGLIPPYRSIPSGNPLIQLMHMQHHIVLVKPIQSFKAIPFFVGGGPVGPWGAVECWRGAGVEWRRGGLWLGSGRWEGKEGDLWLWLGGRGKWEDGDLRSGWCPWEAGAVG